MTVYVDDAFIPYGRMKMSHMIADTEEELHEMADKIGVKRKWFQKHGMPHYDVCKSKRQYAIEFGTQEISRRELVAKLNDWRMEVEHENPIPKIALLVENSSLTRRQIEVLQHIANGLTNREIAIKLDITRWTVRNHNCHVYERLNATCAAHAVAIGIREGIIK